MARYGFDHGDDGEPATCIKCGGTFYRSVDERWKNKCLDCWRRAKNAERARTGNAGFGSGYAPPPPPPPPPPATHPILGELAVRIRTLIQLVHPDKHGGSFIATQTTQWLLDVRKRLGGEP